VIDWPLRALLDEVQVSKVAEYLAQRLELEQGETMLQLEFVDGHYDRLRRYDGRPHSPRKMPRTAD